MEISYYYITRNLKLIKERKIVKKNLFKIMVIVTLLLEINFVINIIYPNYVEAEDGISSLGDLNAYNGRKWS